MHFSGSRRSPMITKQSRFAANPTYRISKQRIQSVSFSTNNCRDTQSRISALASLSASTPLSYAFELCNLHSSYRQQSDYRTAQVLSFASCLPTTSSLLKLSAFESFTTSSAVPKSGKAKPFERVCNDKSLQINSAKGLPRMSLTLDKLLPRLSSHQVIKHRVPVVPLHKLSA